MDRTQLVIEAATAVIESLTEGVRDAADLANGSPDAMAMLASLAKTMDKTTNLINSLREALDLCASTGWN